MPTPISPIKIATSVLSGVGTNFLNAALNPATYAVSGAAWRGAPIMLPPSDAVIDAYQRGMLGFDDANTNLLYSGVSWLSRNERVDRAKSDRLRRSWGAIADLMKSRPDASILTHAYAFKRITQGEFIAGMKRAGADMEDWSKVATMYRNTPSIEQVCMAYERNIINRRQWETFINLHGGSVCDWEPVLPLFHAYLTPLEANILRNRNFIGDGEWGTILNRHGFNKPRDLELFGELRKVLPSISDLITMQRREVFHPELASRLGLFDEAPEQAKRWLEAQGLIGGPGYQITSDGKQRDAHWADLLWGLSWLRLSPTMTFEAVRKLRPGRVERWVKGLNMLLDPILANPGGFDQVIVQEAQQAKDQLAALKPFTVADAFRELRVADWPPALRPLLLALTFTPLRLVDIRSAYISGARDRQWFIEQQRDRGIAPDDAETLADIQDAAPALAARRRVIAAAATASGNTIKLTIRGYEQGMVEKGAAKGALQLAGLTELQASLIIDNSDGKVRLDLHKQAISTIGRLYIIGEVSRAEATEILKGLPVNDDRVSHYFATWDLQRTRTRKQLTTAKIQRLVVEGLLPVSEAARRLTNLGWSQADLLLLLSEARASSVKARQREAAAEERSRRQASAELQRGIEDLEAETNRLRAELRRQSPVSVLQRWLKKGNVGKEFFNARMAAMGYPDDITRRYRREALPEDSENGDS